jgi:hypothetical protein
MSDFDILSQFKTNLISFFDELIDQFPDEGDLVIVRIFLKDQIPIEDVMKMVVVNLNKDDELLKKMIKERNENFFLENNLFDNSSKNKDKILHFKKIWRSNRLDDDDRQTIWRWIDTFVYLANKYSKNKM